MNKIQNQILTNQFLEGKLKDAAGSIERRWRKIRNKENIGDKIYGKTKKIKKWTNNNKGKLKAGAITAGLVAAGIKGLSYINNKEYDDPHEFDYD